jgi:hypothetical protein
MSDTQLISLRMPGDVLRALDEMAANENRSRGQMIAMIVRDKVLPDAPHVKTPTKAQRPKKPDRLAQALAVPGVTTAAEIVAPVSNAYTRPVHDPATCRNKFCILCNARS